jgi:hypothetical protein
MELAFKILWVENKYFEVTKFKYNIYVLNRTAHGFWGATLFNVGPT